MSNSNYFLKFPDVEEFSRPLSGRNIICGYEVADANHESTLNITFGTVNKLIKFNCSCTAGTGGQCKQSKALLIHLTR